MFKNITLGKFSYDKGGQIYLAPGDNMEYGLESSSCMHELFHAHLALASNVGMLMHLIELELNSEQEDLQYMTDLISIRESLYESTRTVQEVYANSLELLWVEENYGIEERNRVYEKKTIDYKQYLDIAKVNWDNVDETIEKRKKKINKLCISVLDMDILAEQFWLWLQEPTRLGEIIADRLNYAFTKQECIKDSKKLNQDEIIELAKKKFNYLGDRLEEGFQYSKKHLNLNLTELLLENVKVFDYSELGITEGKQYDSKCGAVGVVKVLHISDGSVGTCIIQHFMEEGIYEIVELDKSKMHEILKEKRYVIVPGDEFLFNKNEAKCEEINDKIKVVLLDTVRDFKKWVQNIMEYEEIYIGDINEKGAENFFTVIYFRKRKCDKVIYMFPTLSIIANNIFEELQIAKQVKYPGNGMGFYNIFSAFNDWGNILKVLKETISFVTKSKGNIIHNDNPCSKLLNPAKFDIGDNIFKIVGKNYFYTNAVLPTLQTEAEPFWILMEFENGENNGNIKCETKIVEDIESGENTLGIVYFYDKSSAENYRKRMVRENPELINYQAVGMDEVFWLEVKRMLQMKKIAMIFVRKNAIEGICNDGEQFEYLRLLEMKKR